MSTSTGAASSSAGKESCDKKEPQTVSDLLLQGPTSGAFEDWLPAVREKADQDCENWVKKAQVLFGLAGIDGDGPSPSVDDAVATSLDCDYFI